MLVVTSVTWRIGSPWHWLAAVCPPIGRVTPHEPAAVVESPEKEQFSILHEKLSSLPHQSFDGIWLCGVLRVNNQVTDVDD